MKTKSKMWCNIQELLLDMKCPGCFSKEIKECECDSELAECEKCGCTFKLNSAVASHHQS